MLWKILGTLVSRANSSVGIQSCPTPPRHPAVRSVPTRQWYVRVLASTGFGHWTNKVVRHACRSFFVKFKVHSYKNVRVLSNENTFQSTCQVQKPDIPRAGRIRAHGGVAGRGWAGLNANRTVRLGDNPFLYHPKHRRHVA